MIWNTDNKMSFRCHITLRFGPSLAKYEKTNCASFVPLRGNLPCPFYFTYVPDLIKQVQKALVIVLHELLFSNKSKSEAFLPLQNRGKRMIEGAHINRSLLALGNCINALS